MISKTAWLDLKELSRAVSGKDVIYWGSAGWFDKTHKLLGKKVKYIVDISKNQQGPGAYRGYDVLDPSCLENIKDKNSVYVIITTTAFYEVIAQLESYGYHPGKNFSVSPLLRNFKVIDDICSHNADLLISSSDTSDRSRVKGGGIYSYSIPSGRMKKEISGITRGFDWYGDHLYVVDALKGVRIFDRAYKEIDFFPLPDRSIPHGIAVDASRKVIYVVLCLLDKIGVYDLSTNKMLETISISDKFERTGEYNHHINDICVDGGSLFMSMFSLTGNVQKNCFDGGIMEYDLFRGKVNGVVESGLWQPHSVRILDGGLCYLDSMRGDLHISSHKTASHFNGFVRGLDFDGSYYYVAQSLHRYFDRMQGVSNNISMDCGIFLFDNDSKASKFFPTPALKDINTLKMMPGAK